jgi:hypothetical protein
LVFGKCEIEFLGHIDEAVHESLDVANEQFAAFTTHVIECGCTRLEFTLLLVVVFRCGLELIASLRCCVAVEHIATPFLTVFFSTPEPFSEVSSFSEPA